MMTDDAFVFAHFRGARRCGDAWEAHCPAHEDHTPSLSIKHGDTQPWVLHCHAGCDVAAVVRAAGLAMTDILGPRPNGGHGVRPPTTYDYCDEAGTLLYQVVREHAPKKFWQRRPDGAGGWIHKLEKVRRVLYRLPQLKGQSVVYIPEGEKDVDRCWHLGLAATTNAGGAGKWRDDYAAHLTAAGVASVIVLPDNDDPGRAHAEAVARSCHAAGVRVQIVALPGLAPKGDVSDWLDAGHTRDDLIASVTATPRWTPTSAAPEPLSTACTLAHVEKTFAHWIRDDDPIPTRALLAAYVANRKLDGDPVWLMLVGGAGVGKTERLIPLAVLPDVVLESSITGPAALLSGTGKKERAKDATGGLLRKLPAGGGVLLLKDFTSIIDMHREARAEVLAALREVYDGRWDRSVGAEGGRTLTWTGHLGLVAGCTTAIDTAHSVMSVMGTRFMLIRLHGDQDIAGSAFDHVGEERPMRDALRAAVRGLLEHLPGTAYEKAEVRAPIIALAKYVALARSPVDRDSQGEIRLVLDAEAPTRIVKMLTQLWRASGLLGLEKPKAWDLVRRVGVDSIPKLRGSILNHLAMSVVAPSTTDIAEYVEHPSRTTRRGLEDLAAHQVVRRIAGGNGKADRWELTDQTRGWLGLLATVPVSSEPVDTPLSQEPPPPPLIRTQITNDDITGKVAVGDNG